MFKSYKGLAMIVSKFAASSAIATLIDFCLFIFVLQPVIKPFWAEFISGFIGMTVNFILQKRYVFQLKRNLYMAFTLSIVFSVFALVSGSFMIQGFSHIPFFASYMFIPKIIVVGFKFIFNFYTKRWIFEKETNIQNIE